MKLPSQRSFDNRHTPEGAMADQQENTQKTAGKKTIEKRAKAGAAKASTPGAAEIVSAAAPPSATPTKKSIKPGKLLPKNKHRLPRRLKKAQQKAATRL